ncbi:Polyketide synthase modules and related proteins [hydrothermal vent metagenome]|uniref:Polyketide synthase modules and related proteins n=1 Tax=hydrothermal vent metagenome TaxID=652676 RepID=A0A3B0Y1G6_9ZZZZ
MKKSKRQLVTMIKNRLDEGGAKLAFTIIKANKVEESISYAALKKKVLRLAANLQQVSRPESSVLIMFPTSLDFVVAFLGCLMAGVLPVPLPIPRHIRDRGSFERLVGAVKAANAEVALVTTSRLSVMDGVCNELTLLDIDNVGSVGAEQWQQPEPQPESPAYLQFTSGSSGQARGVILTHAATLANLETIKRTFNHTSATVSLSWLPLYHDMGLVGHVLQPLYTGGTSILMAPGLFSRNPISWLKAISHYQVTTSGAPAFAYEMCSAVKSVEAAELDLRSWKNAYVGADNIPVDVLNKFAKSFESFGFNPDSWLPCYGLAEATLFVAGNHCRKQLELNIQQLAQGWAVNGQAGQRLQSILGYEIEPSDFDIRIVNPRTKTECVDRQVGEIWLNGIAIATAYCGNIDSSNETFKVYIDQNSSTSYMRTGDLGFIAEDTLYLTGRLKDLIIIRGVNHYPEDLERTVLAADMGPAHLLAACFSVTVSGGDELVVVREISRKKINAATEQELIGTIAAQISEVHSLKVHQVVLVPRGAIVRTSSGKISRSACKEAYLANEFESSIKLSSTNKSSENQALDSVRKEVAIIGMACRFPGRAVDLRSFWQCLQEGEDCISEVPGERWNSDQYYDPQPAVSGKMNTRWGGFLHDVDQFDPGFFSISGHEAAEMDPQQRILLEVSWRAFEHAGITEEQLQGSNTGVFVGISNGDYLRLMVRSQPNLDSFTAYSGLGNAYSIAANRLSYVFDLVGPSIAVDTACSSSLTAIHMAAESIRSGECDMAIAGGINLMLAPDATILLSQFGMMAPEGRCKAFDANANGYVRSEGCGMIVLKCAMQAYADGDFILAKILGSAQGQDGGSTGITSPNPQAQRRLLLAGLKRAQADPKNITYIEAHGTGTAIGDPVEMAQLNAVYGADKSAERCYVGSVKANIGHLEAGAGVAGIIKLVLTMQHRQIPRQLHIKNMNPEFDIEGSRLTIPLKMTAWPESQLPRQAAISSFGFGGALVHMVLEESKPKMTSVEKIKRGNHFNLMVLSAKTADALRQLAKSWIQFLETQRFDSMLNLCHIMATRRSHFRYRLTATESAQSGFRQSLQNASVVDSAAGVAVSDANSTAFIFSGQSGQFAGMGHHLYADYEVFREAFDRCARTFDSAGSPTLMTIVFSNNEPRDIDSLTSLERWSQPALFALEYALAKLWMSWGVKPAVLLGHSLGEITAACVAGCMEPEAAMHLVEIRGRLMTQVSGNGGMLSVFAGAKAIKNLIDLRALGVSIAAVNAPGLTVISGPITSLESAEVDLTSAGIKCRSLNVIHAFHSAMMDSILDEYESLASQIRFKPPTVTLISSVSGQPIVTAPTAQYWREHLRHCVQFASAVNQVVDRGIKVFIEVGPGRALCSITQQCHPAKDLLYCCSLDEDTPGKSTILQSLGRLYIAGANIDWQAVYHGPANMPDWSIPVHPFRHQRYWFDEKPVAASVIDRPKQQAGPATYVPVWQERPLDSEITKKTIACHWIIVGEGNGFSNMLEQGLRSRGDSVFFIRPSVQMSIRQALFARIGSKGRIDINVPVTCDGVGYAKALNKIINRLGAYSVQHWRVIYVAALDCVSEVDTTLQSLEHDQSTTGVLGLTSLLQGMNQVSQSLSLWVVTRNAQAVCFDTSRFDSRLNVSQAPLWGLMRTAFLEHPSLRGGLIDLDEETDPAQQLDNVLAQIYQGSDEAQVAFRGSKRYIESLNLLPIGSAKPDPLALDPDATYIITGGMGGLGLCCAQWLSSRGAGHVILLGRHEPPPPAEWNTLEPGSHWAKVVAAIKRIETQGTKVKTIACDVRKHQKVEQLLTSVRSKGRLGGILHAAGVNWLAKIADIESSQLSDALAINVSAAWNLHQLSQEDDLDFFILFSSVSALWGSVDLSHYTASNYFLDALCHLRRKTGKRALCIDWGPWADVGMSAKSDQKELLEMLGLNLIRPNDALASMERLIVEDRGQCVIADFNWSRFQAFVSFSLSPSLFDGVSLANDHQSCRLGSIEQIAKLGPDEAREYLVKYLRMQLAAVLHSSPTTEIGVDTRFNFMGMDSLTGMAFCARLETQLGVEIPAMTVYNYPTIGKMVDFIYQQSACADEVIAAPIHKHTELFFVEPAQSSAFRLFCFPYAGAGPSVFSDWSAGLSDAVNVVPLALPGRENRIAEKCMKSMKEIVNAVVDALEPNIKTPYGFFGHSLGGLLCFEVTRELARRKLPLPQPLVVSACEPPKKNNQENLHRLDDAEFLDALTKRFGIVPEAGWDETLKQRLLPALRADMELSETAQLSDSGPIPCMIHLFGGNDDILVPPNRLSQWSSMSSKEPSIQLFNGDHMFIRGTAKADVITAVDALISQQQRGELV